MLNPFRAITSWAEGIWTRLGGLGWGRMRFYLPGSRFDYEREAGDLWANSVVAIGIKWLGDRFPKPLLRISKIARNGDYVPLPRHEMVDLWNRPNKLYTRRTIEKAVGLSLVVDGNAYLWKRRSRLGSLSELWWIPHWTVFPLYPADGSEVLSGWQVIVDGMPYYLPVEDVIHIRDGIDPRNVRLGLSAVKAQLREVCTINEESGYTASILKNAGVPGLMISPAPGCRFDKPQADALKQQIQDRTSGDKRGDAIAIAGAVDVKQLGFSPEQLRLDRLPQAAISRIAAAMGTAAMSLGLPDPGKTYANLTEANRASWGTITAIQELIGEALRWQLLNEFADPYKHVVEYDYSHISELQEDLTSKSNRVRGEWKDGIRRQNEAREELGLEPDPDGDRFFPGTGADEPMLALPPARTADPAAAAAANGDGDGTENGDGKSWRY